MSAPKAEAAGLTVERRDERDEARAAVERVRALADEWRRHEGDHGPICPTCDMADDVDTALGGA